LAAICLVMLVLIGSREGWGKVLKITAAWFLFSVGMMEIFLLSGHQRHFRIWLPSYFSVFGPLQWCAWGIGLITYYVIGAKTRIACWIRRLALLLLVCIPIPVIFLFIFRFGVNVLYWDQWRIVPILARYLNGTLQFSHLFEGIVEQREFFGTVITLVTARLTHYNTCVEMYVNACILLLSFCVVLASLKERAPLVGNLFFLAPISYLMLGPNQIANILYGAGLSWVLVHTCAIASLYFLYSATKQPARRKATCTLIVAMLLATVATFSLSMGMCVWFAGCFLAGRRPRPVIGSWAALGLLESLFYFHTPAFLAQMLAKPLAGAASLPAANHVGYLSFFPLFLGSAVTGRFNSLAWGISLLSLSAVCLALLYAYGQWRQNALWLSILLFATCATLLIFVGRVCARADLAEGLAHRYKIFAILIVASLYMLMLNLRFAVRGNFVVTGSYAVLTCLIVIGAPVSFFNNLAYAQVQKSLYQKAASVLVDYEVQSDDVLQALYKEPQFVRKNAAVLKKLKYNVFSVQPQNMPKGAP